MREREHAAAVLNDTTTPPLRRLRRYFSDLVKLYGPSCIRESLPSGRFSLEIAEESPQLRKRISASFDHWQHTITTVIRQAVAQKGLPAGTDPVSPAGFLLNSWEGTLLRSQAEKSNAAFETFMRYVFDGLLTKESKRKARGNPLIP